MQDYNPGAEMIKCIDKAKRLRHLVKQIEDKIISLNIQAELHRQARFRTIYYNKEETVVRGN